MTAMPMPRPTAVEPKSYGTLLQIGVIWLMILTFGVSALSGRQRLGQADVKVLPVAVRPGEPVIASYEARNPRAEEATVQYEVWAGADRFIEGRSTLQANTQVRFQLARAQGYEAGTQVHYGMDVRPEAIDGTHDWQQVSIPPYAPQVWSSFVSFAAFSTSIMSSFTSMMYYQNTFAPASMLNVGGVMTITLTGILIALESISPRLAGRPGTLLSRVHPRFQGISFLLLIVFVGVVLTRIVTTMSTI